MTSDAEDSASVYEKALDIAEKHLDRALDEGGEIAPYVAVAMIEAAVNAAVDETSPEDIVEMLRDLIEQIEADTDSVDDD